MPGLAGDFYERGEKLEAFAELMSIDCFGNHILVIGDDPAYFVSITVTPQDPADWPDIGLCTAMRARANRIPAVDREWNHIV